MGDHVFIWETARCHSFAIFDSRTVTLKGVHTKRPNLKPKSVCTAVRTDLKVRRESDYTMSVDFFNIYGDNVFNIYGRGNRSMAGYPTFALNYWDANNYDFVYKRVAENSAGFGSIKNGVMTTPRRQKLNVLRYNPPIDSGKWYNLKIEVLANRDVTFFLNDQRLGSFKAHFLTRGYGGVGVLNKKNNEIQFRNYDVAPIL